MSDEKPISESLFETYLLSQGLKIFEYEKVWNHIPTHPDYTVHRDSEPYLFEVKQFKNQTFPNGCPPVFTPDRYRRIRENINQAQSQLKYFRDRVCAVVLYTLDPFIRLNEPSVILGAMYGDLGFTTLYDKTTGRAVPYSTKRAFLRNGKMFRIESGQPQNQTISALVTLRLVGETKAVGVIVWENYYARNPFPRDMFCGPYDQRWGKDGDSMTRIFVGERLLDYEKQQAS